jgi:diaminopimelate decarboxylase
VKASSNLGLLHLFAHLGAGFDIVSGGELLRVLQAKGEPSRVVFSGVGKTYDEMARAHREGILLFNVESAEELELLDAVGREVGRPAPFAVRVNPEVNPRTHRHIATGLKTSKFGVPFDEASALYARSRKMKGVVSRGVDCHIGSQLTSLAPLEQALRKVSELASALMARARHLLRGRGRRPLGIVYRDEAPASPVDYARARWPKATAPDRRPPSSRAGGRVITGSAGVLLCRVIVRKRTGEDVRGGGRGDERPHPPALYEAHHEVLPVKGKARRPRRRWTWWAQSASPATCWPGRALVLPRQETRAARRLQRRRLRHEEHPSITTRSRARPGAGGGRVASGHQGLRKTPGPLARQRAL